jgi:hypothetical protein
MKLSLIAAGAALIGLTSFAAPASAHPVPGLHKAAPAHVQVARFHRHKRCHWRKIVTRDHFGIRRVKTVRICRR